MTDQAQEGKETIKEVSPSPDKQGVIVDEPREPVSDFGPLFGDEEKFTEDQLRGTQVEDKKPSEEVKATPQEKKEEPATPEPKGEAKETKKEEKKEEEKKEEATPQPPPPKGFVPQQALTEARTQLKALKEEVGQLRSALSQKPAEVIKPIESSEDAKWKDFKELTDEEYEKLLDDEGPVETQKYDRKLRQYEKYKEQKARVEEDRARTSERLQSMISESAKKIEEAVPGIYAENSDTISRLATFAAENGFENEDYLEILTNPETLIIPKNADKPYLNGPGALGLIKLLHGLQKKLSSPTNPTELRKQVEKELEPILTERITKQLLSKMRGTDKELAYRSLTEVPGSELAPEEASRTYSEEEWGRLPEEKRRQLLGG